MNSPARTLPLLPVASRELAQDPECAIDRSPNVYADVSDVDFGEYPICPKNPNDGHCTYSSADGHRHCIYCGE
jgi:hypothetical protein